MAIRGVGFLQNGNWFSNAFSTLQRRKSDPNSSHLLPLKERLGASGISHFLGGSFVLLHPQTNALAAQCISDILS